MFGSHSQRIYTGLALLAVVLIVGFIDNFFLMWLFFGIVYILAFKEAMKLFGIKKDFTLYAILLWIIAFIYPYGDDLFILAGVGYAGMVAYNKDMKWKNFLPFIYPTAGMLFILSMYREYGVISLFWLLVVVALTDVGAYAVGKSIGKTKFCETSPNKTMEGASVAVVCDALNVPFFILRAISDTADTDASFSFDEFMESSAIISAEFIMKMVDKIIENK
jgi:phosphatidate cytidylyltransferase